MSDEDHVKALIEELVPGSFVAKFVLVAEVIGADGDRNICWVTSEDMRKWDIYGLLTYALEEERVHQRENDE